jgi:hypothetical protein
LRENFIIRHEKSALRWSLVFYREEKGWVVTDFKFDGNLALVFSNGE